MPTHKIYNSISEFFKSINLEIEQNFDFTIHALDKLHGEPPTQSPFFRTNYYAFLLIEDGKGSYTIDDQTFPLHQNCFYFTNPGHLKSFHIQANLKGFMLTFSEAFLKSNYPLPLDKAFPFLFRESTPVMDLPEIIFKDMKITFEVLWREYNGKSPYKKQIVGSQLVAILFKTKELLLKYKTKINIDSRSADITNSFHKALNNNILNVIKGEAAYLWNVNDYAQFLNLHPNHLSNTIKSETGKTVKQWIDEKVHSEAKTLLLNTNKTISEIALDLTFSDGSNFSRFFKKMEGVTPGKFRKSV